MICRTLYLIDEEPESRRELIRLLARIDIESWPFQSPSQFLAMLSSLEPAPILVAIETEAPGESLKLMEELIRQGFDWPVIATAAEPDMRIAVEAMKRGAIDFLDRPVVAEKLEEAVAAADDQLGRSARERSARRAAEERLAALTARERDVARALVQGMGNKNVAHHLGLSVRTVEMHRSRLIRKLGVRSLAEAAVLLAQAETEPAGASRWALRRAAAGRGGAAGAAAPR